MSASLPCPPILPVQMNTLLIIRQVAKTMYLCMKPTCDPPLCVSHTALISPVSIIRARLGGEILLHTCSFRCSIYVKLKKKSFSFKLPVFQVLNDYVLNGKNLGNREANKQNQSPIILSCRDDHYNALVWMTFWYDTNVFSLSGYLSST